MAMRQSVLKVHTNHPQDNKYLVNRSTVASVIKKSAYAIYMYKYLTRVKNKHQGVTN
jgi:hypothetical protein